MTTITGADFKTWVLLVVGNILIVLIVVRLAGAFARKEWGEMIALLIASVVVGAFVWFPDGTIAVLKGIAAMLLK